MDITWYLVLSALLFAVGVSGVLLRRSPLVILLCLELMLNAGNLALLAFSRAHGNEDGQVFAIIVMVVAACNARETPPARERIVSVAPNLTEMLFAAGAADQVVAVSAYSDYPEAAKGLPQIGDAFRLDYERIVALAPTVAVVWETGTPAGE